MVGDRVMARRTFRTKTLLHLVVVVGCAWSLLGSCTMQRGCMNGERYVAMRLGVVDRVTGKELCIGRDAMLEDAGPNDRSPEATFEFALRAGLGCAYDYVQVPGLYHLSVSAPGYQAAQFTLDVDDHGSYCDVPVQVDRTLLLEPAP